MSKKGLHEFQTNYGSMVILAVSHAYLGHEAEARSYVDDLLRLIPRFTLTALRKNPMFIRPEHIERLVEGMRLAGLPEYRNSAPQPKFANRSANKSKNPSASTSCKTRAFLARFVTPHQSTTVAPRVSFELVSISTLHMRP